MTQSSNAPNQQQNLQDWFNKVMDCPHFWGNIQEKDGVKYQICSQCGANEVKLAKTPNIVCPYCKNKGEGPLSDTKIWVDQVTCVKCGNKFWCSADGTKYSTRKP